MAAVVKGRIEGDSSGFRASVNQAMASVNEFRHMAEAVAPSVAAAFSVHGLMELGKDAIETGAHIYDLAQRIGVGTSTIQKFGYAAKLSGTDAETLVRGLLKLQANIANGGIETEKYQKALEKLGLTTASLVDVSPEEAMLRLADAFAHTESRGEANAAMVALLGSRMSNLIPLFAEGRKGLEEMFENAPQMAEATVLEMKQLSDEMQKWKSDILPGVASIVGWIAEKFRDVSYGFSASIQGSEIAANALKRVLSGESIKTVFNEAKGEFDRAMSDLAEAHDKKIKPPVKGNFESPDAKADKSSELARLDELQFQNRLKLMDTDEKIAALKERELAISKEIAKADKDAGTSDDDYLKLQIERERIRGEILNLDNKKEKTDRPQRAGNFIYGAPLQMIGAASRAVFAQRNESTNPAERTNRTLEAHTPILRNIEEHTRTTHERLVNS
jgi:hypothetical protein